MCGCVVCVGGEGLEGAEHAVACVAEAGEDVADVGELSVHGRDVDGNIGVMVCEVFSPSGCGDEIDQTDGLTAAFFEVVDRSDGAASGGKHGVDDHDEMVGNVGWKFFVVTNGFECFFIALHAEVADLSVGENLERSVSHAESSAEDGDDGDVGGQAVAIAWFEWRIDGL